MINKIDDHDSTHRRSADCKEWCGAAEVVTTKKKIVMSAPVKKKI